MYWVVPVSAIVHVLVPLPVAWRSVVGMTILLSLGLFAFPVSVNAKVVFGAGLVPGAPPLQEVPCDQELLRELAPFVLATVKVFEASGPVRKSSLPLPPSPVQATCVPVA